MISQTISHYRIISKLGAGGMREVYLADDTKLDRKVAIKFLPAESIADERAKSRLFREPRAVAKLDHRYTRPRKTTRADSSLCIMSRAKLSPN